jgi:hypothetical protein
MYAIRKITTKAAAIMVAFIFRRTSIFLTAKILLFSITLLLIGPQLGGLDADGDGYPEVPIIVLTRSAGATFAHALNIDPRTTIIAVAASLVPALVPDDLGDIVGRELVSHQRGPRLRLFGVLRC